MKKNNKLVHVVGLMPLAIIIISVLALVAGAYQLATILMIIIGCSSAAVIIGLLFLDKSKQKLFYILFNICLLGLLLILNIIYTCRGGNTPPKYSKCANAVCPTTCKSRVCNCIYVDNNGKEQSVQCAKRVGE